MTVHDFHEKLAKSHEYENAPWWREVYAKAFPGFMAMVSVRKDGWAQRGGIDRIVTLTSGKTITIDEKVREKSYPDILLERWSDKHKKIPGWVQKDLACDFIAYAVAPTQTCWLLPFPTLRAVWIANGRNWIVQAESGADGFRIVDAQNKGYVTESVAVPVDILLGALTQGMTVHWSEARTA